MRRRAGHIHERGMCLDMFQRSPRHDCHITQLHPMRGRKKHKAWPTPQLRKSIMSAQKIQE